MGFAEGVAVVVKCATCLIGEPARIFKCALMSQRFGFPTLVVGALSISMSQLLNTFLRDCERPLSTSGRVST